MFTIYALVDPRDHTTRYVGVTQDVYERFIQHLRCDGSNHRKDAWIKELKEANKMVIMTTLQEVCSAVLAQEREVYWIHHFLELGITLYNNSIPTPLHLRRYGKPGQIKIARDMKEAAILISNKGDAVRELLQHGYNQSYIIKKVWGVSKGSNPKYKKARDEYQQIVEGCSAESKREQVRELRSQDCSMQQIIYQVWGANKGSSVLYVQARQEYQQIVAWLNSMEGV